VLTPLLCTVLPAVAAAPGTPEFSEGMQDLARLTPGRTGACNALWIENPMTARFNTSKRVVVADIRGPAWITMIHFALPQSHFLQPPRLLSRELLIRMYWDDEEQPSVDCPFVDFFCDPAGTREMVNTALVNKRRGWNAYFPMPFRRAAKIELLYDGPLSPGDELWSRMPCYSYVMYRTVDRIPDDVGYFHAGWRQEGLLLGRTDYLALEAAGRGRFIGWNASVRRPGRSDYPVDMNEKFYIDGEPAPSIEFQGIEDSFGFSWGFPESENLFPLTGYFPFFKGAAAYRFFIPDAIRFEKSLRVTIGFGTHEDPVFRREFSKPGNTLQLSTTCYWYQTEPHAPLPAVPPAADRAPAPDDPFWPGKETLPTPSELRDRGVKLHMLCGRSKQEVVHAEPGYAAEVRSGYSWEGWALPVYHCRAAETGEVRIDLTVPRSSSGLVRVYIIDPDNHHGGRRQTVAVEGRPVGTFEKFQEGRWIEVPVGPEATEDGRVTVTATNARPDGKANAVISILEWVEKK